MTARMSAGAAAGRRSVEPAPAVASPRPNPFDDALAVAHSSYAAFRVGELVRAGDAGGPASPLARLVHDCFRALVLSPGFSCLGAKAAVGRGAYRTGIYGELDSPEATAGLARDLFAFVEEQPALAGGFTTFVASFAGPAALDEAAFERLLWRQLQRLHDEDRRHHAWDPSVSADPAAADFSFSFAGRAFFVVGLHPASSRWARRFAWPTLVFNAHEQFERLRADGRFEAFRARIRDRERALQGSINPNLSDFGERSEARQYAGRPVDDAWRCPFRPGPPDEGPAA